ncbi:MAG: hypothetical protein RLZZ444_4373 [Pseudomonadota bacterium]|jgi:hypothetical protein
MRPLLALFLALAFVNPAAAADASAPAKELLEIMVGSASDAGGDSDYFSEDRLNRLYSDEFAKLYRAAWKKQESDENGGYLLGYDPITMAQDGCPIKDLSIETLDDQGGWLPVIARFKAFYCFSDDNKDKVEIRQFIMVPKGDGWVIDDIQSVVNNRVEGSVKTNLEELSK